MFVVSMSLIPSGELKESWELEFLIPGTDVSMSLIPSGELKAAIRAIARDFAIALVSMSLIPSGELKGFGLCASWGLTSPYQ